MLVDTTSTWETYHFIRKWFRCFRHTGWHGLIEYSAVYVARRLHTLQDIYVKSLRTHTCVGKH